MLEKTRNRLILWNLTVTGALLTVVIVALYAAIATSIQNEIDSDLTQSAATLLATTRFMPLVSSASSVNPSTTTPGPVFTSGHAAEHEGTGEEREEREEGRLETHQDLRVSVSNVFYFVVDTQGKVLVNSRQLTSAALPDQTGLRRALQGQSFFQDIELENDIHIRLYSVPLRAESGSGQGQIVGMLQVGQDLRVHQAQLHSVLAISGGVAVAGIVLALLASFFLTGRALVPVRFSLQRQRDFVADASHELRTPLTLIRANTEVALRHKNHTIGEETALLTDIQQETDYLTRLVSDLLTLAQADSHKLELKPEPVEMVRLVRETVRQLTPLAEAKQLGLKLTLPPDESELWLVGDPLRLKQLLLILGDNAIKYTSAGQVQLRLERGRNQRVVLSVADTGIGISQDKLEVIFERFYRVDKARSRSEGGFGLGLAIAQWIVAAHKGTIQVSSQPGQGSSFTVALPANLPPALAPR